MTCQKKLKIKSTGFKSPVRALLMILLFGLVGTPAAAQTDGEEESVYRLMVTVPKGLKTGSAFLFGRQRLLATNYHVIKDAEKIEVYFSAGDAVAFLPVRVVDFDEAKDLAILDAGSDLPGDPLTLANYDPRIDGRAIAIGFPGAADIVSQSLDPTLFRPSVTSGTFSRVVQRLPSHGDARVLQHQAPISAGNSGGPLLDECRSVVGINTFIPNPNLGAQGIFFAVHAIELVRLARKNAIDVVAMDEACQPGKPFVPPAAALSQESGQRERIDEILAFARFARCTDSGPCEARGCKARYERRTKEQLAQFRRNDIDLLVGHAGSTCQDRRDQQEMTTLQSCLRKSPCQYVSQCETVFVRTVSKEASERRRSILDELKLRAEGQCKSGPAGVTPASQFSQKNDSPAAPPSVAPSPDGVAAVSPKVYYGNLQYDPSPQRDEEFLRGNCRNERVRITVTQDFQVLWELREATRVSYWQGRVEALTGLISVQRENIRIELKTGGAPQVAAVASAAGKFSKSRVVFGPCGAGWITISG
jgi:hypothetical protein